MQLTPKTQHEFKRLSLYISILIFTLVAGARTIEPLVKSVFSLASQNFLALAAFALMLIYFVQKKYHFNLKYLTLLLGPVAATCLLEPLPVEYTHILLYGALSYCLAGSLGQASSRLYLRVIVLAQIVSLIDEGLQGLHPERFFDIRDLGFNFIGAITGLIIKFSLKPKIPPV